MSEALLSGPVSGFFLGRPPATIKRQRLGKSPGPFLSALPRELRVGAAGALKFNRLRAAVAPDVLAALRHIAESQGRQFQAVLDDALRGYIDRQQKERPRRHVMTAFSSSLEEFDSLYRDLAK
jgi:hypothetical protein